MSHFYLTLPSNSSMGCYPDNTAARFTTKLPTSIDLSGDWEVALAEITYPREIYNIRDDDCTVAVYDMYDINNSRVCEFSLPKGTYSDASDIVNAINEKLLKLCVRGLHELGLTYDATTRKVTAHTLICDGVPVELYELEFSPMLAKILGFARTITLETAALEGQPVGDIGVEVTSLYVYCDVIEPTVVGDSKVQLLRTVPLVGGISGHHIFSTPIYVPLLKRHFDCLEINIMTDTGDVVPFAPGKSVIILHFRRSSNPYFLLQK